MLENSGSLQINGGVTVRVRKGLLDFPDEFVERKNAVMLDGETFFGDVLIKSEIINANEIKSLQNVSKQGLEYYLDCDKIHGRVIVRSREDGDKITLASRKCTKSIKKRFNELSIPSEKRNSVAVFSDESGVILVEGAGVAQRAASGKETKKILMIKIIRR